MRAMPKKLTTAMRAILRILILREKDRNAFDRFMSFESHRTDVPLSTLETYAQILSLLRSVSSDADNWPTSSDLIDIFCKFTCNSFSICNGELVNVGVAVYPIASMLNHSCCPNCAIIFYGADAHLRPMRDIAAGEELTISYIEIAEPRHKRRKELKERYFFDCECSACKQEPEPIARCLQKGCDGKVVYESETTWRCTQCGLLNEELVKQFIALIIENHSAKNANELEDLCKLQSAVFLDNASPLLLTKRALFHAYLSEQRWNDAMNISFSISKSLEMIYPLGHPMYSIQAYATSKLAVFLADRTNFGVAVGLLEKAIGMLSVTHGDKHPLTVEALAKRAEMGGQY
ncbi:hypothetical protein HDU76_005717 [Blyttiomyces sp. JEL0837]|nr:hypothetical protein HDU76_005717 [Blyttiomyces sp. JEL0837]